MKKLLLTVAMLLLGSTTFYAQICSDPVVQGNRREFNKLNSLQKSRVWRTHLAHGLASDRNLTLEQRSVFYDAMDLMDTNPFANAKRRPDITSWVQRVESLFSKAQINKFFTIPTPVPTSKTFSVSFSEEPPRDCGCASGWSESRQCGSDERYYVSCSTTSNCIQSNWGCGPLWLYGCNGQCTYVPIFYEQ